MYTEVDRSKRNLNDVFTSGLRLTTLGILATITVLDLSSIAKKNWNELLFIECGKTKSVCQYLGISNRIVRTQ
ncbi:Hypothetical predicted protein [Octopus vulgaris]|uniref:Uncharacterized protein n=1 Tax=Octopus vulgaris TaxID=6645 RepID=A0AA36BMC3_OCTVU|nr:Hypothetical predicted protein [Octopus vulgaris]